MASFGAYNALVGYLLTHREVMTPLSLAFFLVAMALHFVVTDYGLNEDHKAAYRRVGRWILVVAVLVDWAIGADTEVSKAAVAVLTAFLGEGVVLNVLKEEVPSERQSRFWAFALGAAGYAALLLTLSGLQPRVREGRTRTIATLSYAGAWSLLVPVRRTGSR